MRLRRPGPVAESLVLAGAVFLVSLVWSLTTPLFSTVDESRHINSVIRLMDGGGWPAPKRAPFLEATELAAREAGHPITGAKVPGAKVAPGTAAVAPDGPVPKDERSSLAGVEGTPPGIRPHLDWMTQHPPGYYAALAIPLKLVGADDWRWDHLVLAMRALSCLMVAAAVPFVAAAARLLSGSRVAGLVGAGVILLVPQWFNTSSLVTNDTLLTLFASVMLFAGVRALVRPETLVSSSLLGGLALGLGLLTKGLMLTAVPVLALFLLLAGWRAGATWRHRFWIPLSAGALAFVIGGWWWIRNVLVFGVLQPSNFGSGRNPEPSPAYSLGGYATKALHRLLETFWGSVRTTLSFPTWLLWTASLIAVVAVLVALVTSRHRLALALTFLYPAFVLALTLQHSWEIFWNHGRIQGIQGRYLFGGITALAGSVATTWLLLLRRRATARVGALVAAALFVVVPVEAYTYSARRLWPDGFSALIAEAPASRGFFVVVATLGVVALLGVAATVLASTHAEVADRAEPSSPGLDPAPLDAR